ncbi:beta-ketoacyl synthase N-terminal-like domain-containing protein [Plantactinospora sp. KBS50]|uniref:beta-ketoacyl synthase N-terminal-like domain-containing protein n=1 Tax=Plantactinospora sp. KBS50 TaxID=2024580 RepID=UPI000BAADC54|nr:beta-ketoacyl synthase N-terminal-like domain-containing protein [Plantactinospora sp. KBS50]ASW55344.1 hypothetical protein CIK06_15960 [Plantactinospora sp. KBS50]
MTDAAAVAIVGMSGRFPGARDLDEFWRNLHDGVCSIADFSAAELLADGADPEELRHPGYVPAKGYLADADRFEAELFGFNRAEATALDPQHRLLLEAAWAALEDAGYDPRRAPERTGVYVGGSPTEHAVAAAVDRRLARELGPMQLRILTDREFLAPWVSYRLGLDGPSMTVQTACSTSLTAVHLAAQALLLGECDAALAGGVSVDAIRRRGYVFRDGGIFAPDGRCRPFDAHAAGTVSGSGVGVLVLRRLADALADGDPVRAVVLGTAVTNDGSAKVGFTAPSVDPQARTITEAWSAAGLDPGAAQYLEMHGTGTELGDRVELAAAAAAVGTAGMAGMARMAGTVGTAGGRCGIGSVKSNIGHLDAASGVASLIKVVLMLDRGTIVPSVNIRRPHPDLDRLPQFRLVTGVAPWDVPDGGRRLAGVTGLGVGGTNVHVVLAGPADAAGHRVGPPDGTAGALTGPAGPALPIGPTGRQNGGAPPGRVELLPISARTAGQLRVVARRLADALRSPEAPALADVAHTLRTARTPLPARTYVLAADLAAASDALAVLADGGEPAPPAAPGDLVALGAAWVRGDAVHWPAPASGARRVHLPTYPFAGPALGALTLPGAGPPAASDGGGGGGDHDDDDGDDGRTGPAAVEAAVTELLSGTLGLGGPGDLDQTYFAAGGDSLTAVHLIGRLRDELGIEARIELFLEPISVRELAARLAAGGDGDDGGLLAALLDELESPG